MRNLMELHLTTLDSYSKKVIERIPALAVEVTMAKMTAAFMSSFSHSSQGVSPSSKEQRQLSNHIKGLQRAWSKVYAKAAKHDPKVITDIAIAVAKDFDEKSPLYNQIKTTISTFGGFSTPKDQESAAVDVLAVIQGVKDQHVHLETRNPDMKLLIQLIEALEEKAKEEENVLPIDKIAMMLFNKKAGPVKDLKRSKEAEFLGVSHTRSLITDKAGKRMFLTFDNSTDSGEFEINSLTPLAIAKGSAADKQIRKLYTKHGVASKKKVGYSVQDDDTTIVREVHLGKTLGKNAVKFTSELLSILKAPATEGNEEE